MSAMKHLTLQLTELTDEKCSEALSLTRHFVKIRLDEATVDANLLKAIERHGAEIRKLECNETNVLLDVPSKTLFLEILKKLPKLEKFTFENANFVTQISEAQVSKLMEEQVELVELKYLKEIAINESNPLVLRLLDTSSVIRLKVNEVRQENVVHQSMPMLQELAIRKKSFRLPQSEEKLTQITAPLKKLSLLHIETSYPHTSLLMFMGNIKNTLEELEIGNKFPLCYYEFVIQSLPKLQVLKIHVDRLQSLWKPFRKLQPNMNVKILILYAKKNFGSEIENLIGIFPNAETLALDSDIKAEDERAITNEQMKSIANNLLKLKVLRVRTLENESFDDVNIPTLKELHIQFHRFLRPDAWKKITAACPNIEKLTFDSAHISCYLSRSFHIICANFKKLQHINILNGFEASKENFDDMLRNCSELKSVTMQKVAIEKDPTMIDEFTKKGPPLTLIECYTTLDQVDFDLWGEDRFRYFPPMDLYDDEFGGSEFDSDDTDYDDEEGEEEESDLDDDDVYSSDEDDSDEEGEDFVLY